MSETTLQGAIGTVIELLQSAKTESLKQLEAARETGNIMIIVGSGIDTLVSRLSFIGGVTVNHAPAVEFPPITNFMGEEIVFRKEIIAEDLTASDLEKERFLQKVEKLFIEIETLSPDGILNNYTLPEDEIVLRGVAKKAGVVEYAEKPLTLAFIAEIVAAKTEMEAKALQEKTIEEQLAKQEQITKLEQQLRDAETKGGELSADLLEAENALVDAKPGADAKKAKAVVDQIKAEAEACVELQLSLTDKIAALKA